MTFPVVVSGRFERKEISRGYSWAESRARTNFWMSEASVSLLHVPRTTRPSWKTIASP